jgi:Alpha galactosidase C-terminal beta sandwich domain/Alpha galactosidase A
VPERQTQLSLWSLASGPLILGTDLTDLDPGDLALLENSAVTAVDQDGIPADRVIDSGNEQVFDKRQQNGTWDIGVFNTDTSASHTFSVPLAQLGLSGPVNVTDLWGGDSLGTVSGTFTTTVAPGGHPHLGHAHLRDRRDRRAGQRAVRRLPKHPRRQHARALRRLPRHRGGNLALQRRDQPGMVADLRG